jgi:hypothetical protein
MPDNYPGLPSKASRAVKLICTLTECHVISACKNWGKRFIAS